MKKFISILSLVTINLFTLSAPATAADSDITYIVANTAKNAIEKHFGHVVSDNSANFTSESDDITVLGNVIDAYNEMLEQNDGFASVDGIIHVCDVAFNNLQPKNPENQDYSFYEQCMNFATDLVSGTDESANNCIYTVTKENNSQKHIKYTQKNQTGFIRHNGSLPWRFLNPGALRDSDLKCAILKTSNGSFAVFESEQKGRQALHTLLKNKYGNSTVKSTIAVYAPSDENNIAQYLANLRSEGINVKAIINDLSEAELQKLENAIIKIEGYHNAGEITNF